MVSGYHPDLRWRTVIDGAILVRSGLPWFASNTDLTVPTPPVPARATVCSSRRSPGSPASTPVVAGKPEPPLFEETRRRVGGDRPLVVGDRLDTDIEGADTPGYDSLLVMTGVTGLAELVAAVPEPRPTYVSATSPGWARRTPARAAADGGGARRLAARVRRRRDAVEGERGRLAAGRGAAAWHISTPRRPVTSTSCGRRVAWAAPPAVGGARADAGEGTDDRRTSRATADARGARR